MQKQYKVDWLSVLDIPKEMGGVDIPKLRINPESIQPIVQRTGGEAGALGALVSLYNQLGEQKPELGRLVVKGDLSKPSVVMFVPDKSVADAQPKIKVKAFSLYGISDAGQAELAHEINQAMEEAMRYADAARGRGFSSPRSLEGTFAIHKETSLLVAYGPESFVEMVESIVTACQPRARATPPPRSPGK